MSRHAFSTIAATLLLCACSSHTHTITTGDGTVSVETKGKDDSSSVHVTGKDGTSLDINTGKPITDYPGDVPLYQGKSVMDMKSGEKNARVVAVQTSDDLAKISDFYKSELASKGWKVESTLATDKMSMYTASKDNRQLVVTISSDGKMQSVSQSIGDK